MNIHDNLIIGGEKGIYVKSTSSGSVLGTDLGSNTIIKTTNSALFYQGQDIPGDITGNTLLENSENLITINEGRVAHSSTWENGGTPVEIEGAVKVASGVTLKITKGVRLLHPELYVEGTLKAEGTAEEPVVFTGPKEASAGEWCHIAFEPGSGASVIDHAEVSYGGACGIGMLWVKGVSPMITNSTFRKSSHAGIEVTASGHPVIEGNRFRGNASGVIYSGSGKLAAPNNDWGCASGPKPAGCGDSVTSNVEWEPAKQLPEPDGPCRGKGSQCGEGAVR